MGQVMGALPPARLAGAMLGGSGDAADNLLVERLDWARSWAEAASTSDTDPQCRSLAGACRSLQVASLILLLALLHIDAPAGTEIRVPPVLLPCPPLSSNLLSERERERERERG
jgi:hypothetical protein